MVVHLNIIFEVAIQIFNSWSHILEFYESKSNFLDIVQSMQNPENEDVGSKPGKTCSACIHDSGYFPWLPHFPKQIFGFD